VDPRSETLREPAAETAAPQGQGQAAPRWKSKAFLDSLRWESMIIDWYFCFIKKI
jgi:hypothetical protein